MRLGEEYLTLGFRKKWDLLVTYYIPREKLPEGKNKGKALPGLPKRKIVVLHRNNSRTTAGNSLSSPEVASWSTSELKLQGGQIPGGPGSLLPSAHPLRARAGVSRFAPVESQSGSLPVDWFTALIVTGRSLKAVAEDRVSQKADSFSCALRTPHESP